MAAEDDSAWVDQLLRDDVADSIDASSQAAPATSQNEINFAALGLLDAQLVVHPPTAPVDIMLHPASDPTTTLCPLSPDGIWQEVPRLHDSVFFSPSNSDAKSHNRPANHRPLDLMASFPELPTLTSLAPVSESLSPASLTSQAYSSDPSSILEPPPIDAMFPAMESIQEEALPPYTFSAQLENDDPFWDQQSPSQPSAQHALRLHDTQPAVPRLQVATEAEKQDDSILRQTAMSSAQHASVAGATSSSMTSNPDGALKDVENEESMLMEEEQFSARAAAPQDAPGLGDSSQYESAASFIQTLMAGFSGFGESQGQEANTSSAAAAASQPAVVAANVGGDSRSNMWRGNLSQARQASEPVSGKGNEQEGDWLQANIQYIKEQLGLQDWVTEGMAGKMGGGQGMSNSAEEDVEDETKWPSLVGEHLNTDNQDWLPGIQEELELDTPPEWERDPLWTEPLDVHGLHEALQHMSLDLSDSAGVSTNETHGHTSGGSQVVSGDKKQSTNCRTAGAADGPPATSNLNGSLNTTSSESAAGADSGAQSLPPVGELPAATESGLQSDPSRGDSGAISHLGNAAPNLSGIPNGRASKAEAHPSSRSNSGPGSDEKQEVMDACAQRGVEASETTRLHVDQAEQELSMGFAAPHNSADAGLEGENMLSEASTPPAASGQDYEADAADTAQQLTNGEDSDMSTQLAAEEGQHLAVQDSLSGQLQQASAELSSFPPAASTVSVMRELRPLCIRMMANRENETVLHGALQELRRVITTTPSRLLQPCRDYVATPLMLVVESVRLSRRALGPDGATAEDAGGGMASFPAARSDRVAEAALGCFYDLLQAVPLLEADQVMMALSALLPVTLMMRHGADAGSRADSASFSPHTSEEVLLYAFKCTCCILEAAVQLRKTQQQPDLVSPPLKLDDVQYAPMVGALCHACLDAAKNEADLGTQGNNHLRLQAIKTLRQLMCAVGSAEGLAFFLPGISSAMANQLLHAGGIAAHGSAAAEEALRVLVDALVMVLGDEAVRHVVPAPENKLRSAASTMTSAAALTAMQQLASLHSPSADGKASAPLLVAGEPPPGEDTTYLVVGEGPNPPEPRFVDSRGAREGDRSHSSVGSTAGNSAKEPGQLRQAISTAWVTQSSKQVEERLKVVLPPICQAQKHSLRQALARGVIRLLEECGLALYNMREVFVELLLTLAQDDWPQVHEPCRAWLNRHHQPPAKLSPTAATSSLLDGALLGPSIDRLVEGLQPSLMRGQTEATLQARKLTTALYFGGSVAVDRILQRPSGLNALITSLTSSFKFEGASAAYLLNSRTEGAVYVSTGSSNSGAKGKTADASLDEKSVVELPRMPPCLLHIASLQTYKAFADVARMVGRMAAQTGSTPQGGHQLQRLIDQLLHTLSMESRGDTSSFSADIHAWQLNAASVVTILSEVLFGASGAWMNPLVGVNDTGGSEPVSKVLHGRVQVVLQTVVQPALWDVATYNTQTANEERSNAFGGDAAAAASPALSAQQLGCNALLCRSLLECIGVCARVLGPNFTNAIMKTVLLPLLERLGDPSPFVASAATAAADSICLHAGYGNLSALLARNADYVVDGVCNQLRHLESHPRAPHLLAAVLRKATVAPDLLVMMAEPATKAIHGLSVPARHKQPQYIRSFLHVMLELCKGGVEQGRIVHESADAALSRAKEVAEQLRPKHQDSDTDSDSEADSDDDPEFDAEKRQDRGASSSGREAQTGAAVAEEIMAAIEGGKEPEQVIGNLDEANAQKALRYFQKRVERHKKKEAAGPAGDTRYDPSFDEGGWRDQVYKALGEEETEERVRRTHSTASLVSEAVEAAAPLLLAKDLQACVAAMEVCRVGLLALQATTAAAENDSLISEEFAQAKLRLRPPRPQTPKLLPAVHLVWVHLFNTLKDGRGQVVESSLALLGHITQLAGGQFMMRRIQSEAWPVMRQILRDGLVSSDAGVAQRRAAAKRYNIDRERELAPGMLSRLRVAVLKCVEAVCINATSRAAFRNMAWKVACVLLPFMATSQPPPVRESCIAAMKGLAHLDSDAVWLLMTDVIRNAPNSRSVVNPAPDLLPDFASLLPPLRQGLLSDSTRSGVKEYPLSKQLAAECSAAAAAILHQLESLTPSWHSAVTL